MDRILSFTALATLIGCTSFDDTIYTYTDPLPEHYRTDSTINGAMPLGFQAASTGNNAPSDNRLTDEGAALGRLLFYDVDLSRNHTIACASCHQAEFGFSDDQVLSAGFDGGETGRHSMRLANARFYENGRFFWDQRAATLEDQVLMPFQDPVEMGMTLEEVVDRVESNRRYRSYFTAAFGDEQVTEERISKALAQFVRSMVSTTSRYDEGRAAVNSLIEPFPNFTNMENLGKELFYTPPPLGGLACGFCHGTDAQVAFRAISNGLDAEPTDPGYGEVTGDPLDVATFKAPSLRNVAVGGPYMHDGRFATLEEVIDHYSEGVQFHPTMFPFLINGYRLTDIEKRRLIAFLNTLTDEEMLADPKFSDPW
ncbi:MAG: cytochrome-c peroxidase [Alphaproteobacteria bacterium]|nr:cytochrome-c peroxidase [Alphaproteobacteria bacterium]